jgi:DNA primase
MNRIIFPIKRDGKLVGWQAREVPARFGRPYSARGPKYWGMPGMRKRFMLYNYDNAINKNYLVITEGPTDVHSVGDHAVALLGKSMAYQQYQLVLNHWEGKPVILILDPDAYDEMRGVVQNMLTNNVVIVEILLPEGYDCGDYDKTTLRNIIHSQARQRGVILSN